MHIYRNARVTICTQRSNTHSTASASKMGSRARRLRHWSRTSGGYDDDGDDDNDDDDDLSIAAVADFFADNGACVCVYV